MHPLEPIDWRIERADEHLATLNRERDALLDENNRRIVGHFESNTSEYILRFAGKLPDPRIGLIVGEFGHHLRAALDNLVWQLVRLRGGSPTRRTEFPIHVSRKRYRAHARTALRGVSADDRAAIEAVQPYQNRERASDSYLALLAWLNNMDKHRFVHVGCVVAERFPIPSYDGEGNFVGEFPWTPVGLKDVAKILDVQYVPTIASDDRTELARISIVPSGPNPQVEMQRDATVEIALSDPEQALMIRDLHHIRANVVGIIEAFRPRFDH